MGVGPVIKYLESYAEKRGISLEFRKIRVMGKAVKGTVIINGNEYELKEKELSDFKLKVIALIDEEVNEIGRAYVTIARKASRIRNFLELTRELEQHIKTTAFVAVSGSKIRTK